MTARDGVANDPDPAAGTAEYDSTGQSTRSRREGELRIAAIDIGSNSIRQIIADVGPTGTIRIVDEMKAAPRLGTGLLARRRLNEEAIERSIEALGRMATLARRVDADRIEVVATSAVRDAVNRDEFVQRVLEATGMQVRVLTGEEEARLSHLSAIAHFDVSQSRTVVMDIGGGSLELAFSAGREVEGLASLPFGAIRLTEQWLGPQPREKDIRALRRFVRRELRDTISRRDWRGAQVIGSGGTFTNLAAVNMARRNLGIARGVHGTRVPRAEVEHILAWLAAMSPSERARVKGLNPARADIIVAGIAVAAEVLRRLDAIEVTVSGYGIREGLLLDTAAVQPVAPSVEGTRERSVREFAERCHYELPHAAHVQSLALQLFDAVGERLGCTPEDRQILSDAALLHDVGYAITYDKHHKHSYHLIVHAELLGMTPEEQLMVANVARYHRGALPSRKHRNFAALGEGLRERVVILAALLRVADGFDRGHMAAVDRVEVEWGKRELVLRAVPAEDAVAVRLELWGADRKRGLLERVAGVRVSVAGAAVEATSEGAAPARR